MDNFDRGHTNSHPSTVLQNRTKNLQHTFQYNNPQFPDKFCESNIYNSFIYDLESMHLLDFNNKNKKLLIIDFLQHDEETNPVFNEIDKTWLNKILNKLVNWTGTEIMFCLIWLVLIICVRITNVNENIIHHQYTS